MCAGMHLSVNFPSHLFPHISILDSAFLLCITTHCYKMVLVVVLCLCKNKLTDEQVLEGGMNTPYFGVGDSKKKGGGAPLVVTDRMSVSIHYTSFLPLGKNTHCPRMYTDVHSWVRVVGSYYNEKTFFVKKQISHYFRTADRSSIID